jgi:hypothetical protein
MERFAKRHRLTLNELLGTHFCKSPSVSTFRLLRAQLYLEQRDSDFLIAVKHLRRKGFQVIRD